MHSNQYSSAFFIGFPFTAIVVNIPQSLQAVYGYSPQKAGIALLPLLLLSPVATALSGYLTSNRNVAPVYVILVGSVFQLIGVGLTCLLPALPTKTGGAHHVPASQYGFEAIMGIGFGLTVSTILTLAPLVVDPVDLRKFFSFASLFLEGEYIPTLSLCVRSIWKC